MYKKAIFFIVFLLNVALYVPSAGSVSFSCLDQANKKVDIAGQILQEADIAYISQISEEAAAEALTKTLNRARDAKIAELALEKGLTIDDYADIYQGLYPASILPESGLIHETSIAMNQAKAMVDRDLYRANFGLDQTMTTEAFNQYATKVAAILQMNKMQYVKMYKDSIMDMYKQVVNYYKKFPYPAVTACT